MEHVLPRCHIVLFISSKPFLRLFPLLLSCYIQQMFLIIFQSFNRTFLIPLCLEISASLVCTTNFFEALTINFSTVLGVTTQNRISVIIFCGWNRSARNPWGKLWLSNLECPMESAENSFSITSFSSRSKPWIEQHFMHTLCIYSNTCDMVHILIHVICYIF